jgi:hypothetical protein
MKQLKDDKIKKKHQFYKLFQIKRIVIKKIGTISKGKIN